MADYRLYGLDGVDKVASAVWIEAADDDSAIAVAAELMGERKWELWAGRRLVGRPGRAGAAGGNAG